MIFFSYNSNIYQIYIKNIIQIWILMIWSLCLEDIASDPFIVLKCLIHLIVYIRITILYFKQTQIVGPVISCHGHIATFKLAVR